MNVHDVDSVEYLTNGEFEKIINFLISKREERAIKLAEKYPDYRIRPRTFVPKSDKIIDSESFKYLQKWNIPFYDGIVMETMLHKEDQGFIDVVEFTYQLNCFSKTIFHRMKWSIANGYDENGFMFFIWNDWDKKQFDGRFDMLKKQANTAFDTATNLLDYHINFVYNDDFKFATVDEVRELFDELVKKNIWPSKDGDLYTVYKGASYEEAETDSKDKFYSGKISKLDEIHLRGTFNKIKPILQSLNSKLLFVPSEYEDGTFDGFWCMHKFGKSVWFVPQFLVFFNPEYKF
jgi:hypothetical protein